LAPGCPGEAGLWLSMDFLPDVLTSQCNPAAVSKPTALPTALPETRPRRRHFQDLQLHGPAARHLPCQGLCRFLLQAALSIHPLPTASKSSLLLSSPRASCGQSPQPCCAVQWSCSWAELSLCTRSLLPGARLKEKRKTGFGDVAFFRLKTGELSLIKLVFFRTIFQPFCHLSYSLLEKNM